MYSDLLFASHRCAATPLRPEWLSRTNVPREANLSLADFVARYETCVHVYVLRRLALALSLTARPHPRPAGPTCLCS